MKNTLYVLEKLCRIQFQFCFRLKESLTQKETLKNPSLVLGSLGFLLFGEPVTSCPSPIPEKTKICPCFPPTYLGIRFISYSSGFGDCDAWAGHFTSSSLPSLEPAQSLLDQTVWGFGAARALSQSQRNILTDWYYLTGKLGSEWTDQGSGPFIVV